MDPNGTDEQEAELTLQSNRSDITQVAASHGIQPDLLAGVVYVEVYAGGVVPFWNDINRQGSVMKFTLLGKGDMGITKFGKHAGSMPNLGGIVSRFRWAEEYNFDAHQNLVDAAGMLSQLAKRRYGGRSDKLTSYQMSVVLTEYNIGERPVRSNSKPSQRYGGRFLHGYSAIHTIIRGGMPPIDAEKLRRQMHMNSEDASP